jgi:hypothetical protein
MDKVILSPDEAIDKIQAELGALEPVPCPLKHIFTPNLYTRQIFMEAWTKNSKGEEVQTCIVSKIHKSTHPFNISLGKCAIYNKADDFLGIVEAPYLGVTIAGTRRLLLIIEPTIWTTYHPLDYITGDENGWSEEKKLELLKRIENDLIEPQII